MQMASAYCSNRISLLFGPLALASVVLLRLALGVGTQADWSAFVNYAPAAATLGVVLFVVLVLAPELHAGGGQQPIGANLLTPPAPAAARSNRSTWRAATAGAVAAPQARRRSFASR